MFSLLESRDQIAAAHAKLVATIGSEFKRRVAKNIGFPGGNVDGEVYTDGQHWFWSQDSDKSDDPNPRRLNWFGLFREVGTLDITVEVNTPYEGRNDQVGGFFARDSDTGSTYLFHSGRVGGGKKGVGRNAFLAWSDERLIEVVDSSGDVREGVLVMPVEARAATRSAVRYINTTARFKQAVRAGETEKPEFRHKQKQLADFYSESRGKRKGKRSSKIDFTSRHGDVVDALAAWVKLGSLRQGGRLVKNVFIDLGVEVGNELVEVYEAKSSTVRSDVYSAIGQLMVHGIGKDCRRYMVLPHEGRLAPDLAEALKLLGIRLLRFRLDEVRATILPDAPLPEGARVEIRMSDAPVAEREAARRRKKGTS